MYRSRFFKSFITNPSEIGAILPSSRRLAREMTSGIGMEKAVAIVELGPGPGVFTEEIVSAAPEGARFFVVERNKEMHDIFTRKHPGVKAFNRCASELGEIMAGESVEKLDIVISGLPWASFPSIVQRQIMNEVSCSLRDGGVFVTFAYLQGFLLPAAHRFRRLLKEMFGRVETSRVVWRNAPPAFVYRCWKSVGLEEKSKG